MLIQSVTALGLLTSYIASPLRGSHHLFKPDPTALNLALCGGRSRAQLTQRDPLRDVELCSSLWRLITGKRLAVALPAD